MRFRNKVVMLNTIFLAVALSIFGTVLIYREFKQSLYLETTVAVKKNTMFLSSLDYELKNYSALSIKELLNGISNAANEAYLSQGLIDSTLIVTHENNIIYSSDKAATLDDNIINLLNATSPGEMNYCIARNSNSKSYSILIATLFSNDKVGIVTCYDITQLYRRLYGNIVSLISIMAIVLIICSILMYYISKKLTRPIEQLDLLTGKITNGDYSVTLRINTDDEIGALAENFNKMTESVMQHIDELNLSIRRREQFVAAFTHEIKTPMTSIIGYADTLRTREMSEDQRKMAYNYIFSEGKRLESLSMRLLELLSLKSDEISLLEIDTVSIMEKVVNTVSPALNEKGITLTTDMESCYIHCDRDLLSTVFINLIDNAKKASEEGMTIDFTGKHINNNYVFTVRDYGIGMDEETISHICEEFYKADKTRTRASGGAGLGMSIANSIIEKHNGTLTIESEPSKGSLFTVSIPV